MVLEQKSIDPSCMASNNSDRRVRSNKCCSHRTNKKAKAIFLAKSHFIGTNDCTHGTNTIAIFFITINELYVIVNILRLHRNLGLEPG